MAKTENWASHLSARVRCASELACDFLNVEVVTLCGLLRYHALIVIDLASR